MTAEQPGDRSLSREEALQWLIDELDYPEFSPAGPGENPDNEEPFFDERMRVMGTLAAVVQFMQAVPELKGKEAPLLAPLRALLGVHDGREPSPLFAPVWTPKGPKIATAVRIKRATAAAAVTLLLKSAGGKEAAARQVARIVEKKDARLFTEDTAPHEQVNQWRRTVMEGGDPKGTRHYRNLVAGAKATGEPPERVATKLLSQIWKMR